MLRLLFTILLALPLTGCAMLRPEKAGKYETISADLQGDSKKAAEKNRKAIEELEKGNCDKAKHLVDEALIADINHAPSHNTLGKIHYQMNDYYLAAWEFEFALKISPSTAEYHNNLGLVHEAADRLDDACQLYTAAIELAPQNYQFVSNYARVRIRKGEVNSETRQLLKQVVFMDPRPEWKDWARQQLTQSHLNIPDEECPPGSIPFSEAVPDALQVPEAPNWDTLENAE
jgi:Tfp pilus assembly protein PilF